MMRTERKYIEILMILKEHQQPMGAKRLSELLAERGYVMTDRAVQYYLRYLDESGFTRKIGNLGRVLTPEGLLETESALVDERIGFVISKLERLAFRSTFNPFTSTGDIAYNLTIVDENYLEVLLDSFEAVKRANCGFFNSYRVVYSDHRIPSGYAGIMTVCSITMDGVFQSNGIPVKMAYGGRIEIVDKKPQQFADLISYRGTTIDPLSVFISSGLTSIDSYIETGSGIMLANVREIPMFAKEKAFEITTCMQSNGFVFPLEMKSGSIYNLIGDPNRISLVYYSGMNYVGHAIEQQIPITTEIGAGNVPFSRIAETEL
jgi:HTH-type transcriptional regulator, global nitrogen regulator NrpRI